MQGMELWAIIPELILATGILILLPVGSFLPRNRRSLNSWFALIVLASAAVATTRMLAWRPSAVFHGTYVVDPLAIFVKLLALSATVLTLLATESHFRGKAREAEVAPLLLLACLGVFGLAASDDLALIALFLQITTVASYILVGIDKQNQRSTEGAVKFFLFSAAAGVVMLYGMALLYGLTGSLSLATIGARLPGMPVVASFVALALIFAGFGYKASIVPFHAWVPDAYQGAAAPIAGFISVAPKAAAFAVLLRTLVTAFPHARPFWSEAIAVIAAITMTVGNVAALRQSSAKRLVAWSSIAQAGYLLVGVAAAILLLHVVSILDTINHRSAVVDLGTAHRSRPDVEALDANAVAHPFFNVDLETVVVGLLLGLDQVHCRQVFLVCGAGELRVEGPARVLIARFRR